MDESQKEVFSMKKRLLSLLLSIVLLISTCPVQVFAASDIASGTLVVGDISWRISSNCILTVSGTGNMYWFDEDDALRPPWYAYRSRICG